MRDLVIADKAREDITSCLVWSGDQFGVDAMERYEKLLFVAISEIAENPELPGSRVFEKDILLYHIRHSRERAEVGGRTVKKPRHFVAYRSKAERIEILRVLHDSMDLPAHL